MSIMQEYDTIKKDIGEKTFKDLEKYLNEVTPIENYEIYQEELGDLYYNEEIDINQFHEYDKKLKEKYNIVLLSDIYYTKEGWDKFEKWQQQNK